MADNIMEELTARIASLESRISKLEDLVKRIDSRTGQFEIIGSKMPF